MRKAWLVSAGAVALGAGVLAAAVSVSAAPRSAVVIHSGSCTVFNGDGGFTNVPDGKFAVINNSGTMVQCRAKDVPNSTGKAVHFDSASTGGVLCNANGTYTADWHETVSASGNAVITCRVKN